jgi:phage terminase small subunit
MLAEAIDPDRALREAARVAYSDIRELFSPGGNLLPVAQWPDDIARAVAGVETVRRNVDATDNKTDEVVKSRLWDKGKAQEMLFKHLGLLTETLEHKGEIRLTWEK